MGESQDDPALRARQMGEARILVTLLEAGSGHGPTLSDGKRLFHADHGNKAGTGATISDATLSAARLALRAQKGIEDRTIRVTPRNLLVPPALETTAEKWLASIALADLNRQIAGTTARHRRGPHPILERALIMQNYILNGHLVRVTAPAGGIASGDALIVGNIFGIAAYSSAEGDPVELSTTGVFQLSKASAAALAVGARVAWDSPAKEVTTLAAGRFPIGVAVEAAGNSVTSVAVRLDGVATAAA